jgi:hypothetical protein
MLGRHDDARRALHEARARNPKVLTMLMAKGPKPVRSKGPFITVGGKAEAWLYRVAYFPLWETSGALAWAREIGRAREPN